MPGEGRITRDAGPTGGTPSWRHDIKAPDESNVTRRGDRSSPHLIMALELPAMRLAT